MEKKVMDFLQQEVNQGHIPGAAILVSFEGKTILEEAVGFRTLFPQKIPMQKNTIFDLASLTKVIATTPALLKLVDGGQLHLKDKMSHFFSTGKKSWLSLITIEHLLTHTSGLPAHRPFHKEKLNSGQIIEKIFSETLIQQPGKKVIYSDLGFILLSKIVEMASEQSFATFVTNEIFQQLGMTETGFNLQLPNERFAATAYSHEIGEYKYGVVHDENAESMGGISGHAGLFSTLQDLSFFAQMIEHDGYVNGKSIISKPSIEKSKMNRTAFSGEGRGLGWQMNLPSASAGDLFSSFSYGHTGYTGTSIWFDPTIQLHVILLTNRVHGNHPEAILRLRPRIHNLIRSHF